MKFVNAHGVEYVPHNWLTYDDITLMPRYSNIPSRNDPSIDLTTTIGGGATLATPIISANMDTVTEADMAIAIGKMGGLGILHRFYRSEDAWWSDILRVKDAFNAVAFSIGSAPDDADLVGKVSTVTTNVMVAIDVAHGDSQATALQVKRVATNYPHAIIIAGNVCTPDGAQLLIENGASALKCGTGNGGNCLTRRVTGHGVPQLSAILAIRGRINAMQTNTALIADGGIRDSGDIVKALAAGANAVMIGRLFAGTDEAPGETIMRDGVLCKQYRGQASAEFMADIGKTGVAPEGVATFIPQRGSVKPIMDTLLGGIRSGMTYSGVRKLTGVGSLSHKAIAIEISHAGHIEGTPHGAIA